MKGTNKRKKTTKSYVPQVFMNIKTDYGFKRVFGYKKLLIGFLNALDILPEPIVDLSYLPLEQLGPLKKNRKAVYDLYVHTANAKRFIIEMQISDQAHFAERLLFYASHSIVNQAPRGRITVIDDNGNKVNADWDYAIDGVYVIAILDFIMFDEDIAKDIVIEYVKLMRQKANLVFTDKLEFVIIELPKLNKDEKSLSGIAEKWLYSILHMEELSDCPEVMRDNELLKELYDVAKLNNLTEEEMETYQKSVLEYSDVRSAIKYAEEKSEKRGIEKGLKQGREQGIKQGLKQGREQGIEQGREQGREQERIRLAKLLYKNAMSIECIAGLMGLSKEELSAILDKE
jgi:predicted transposase/invertase (TIGR01784 family)